MQYADFTNAFFTHKTSYGLTVHAQMLFIDAHKKWGEGGLPCTDMRETKKSSATFVASHFSSNFNPIGHSVFQARIKAANLSHQVQCGRY